MRLIDEEGETVIDHSRPPSASDKGHPDPRERYVERAARFATDRSALTRRWNRVANLRLLVAVAGLAAGGYGLWSNYSALLIVGGVLLIGFLVLARYHARLGAHLRRVAALARINEEAVWRVDRAWDRLPAREPVQIPADHPFAADLDLFGRASLFQLLSTTTTPMGEAALARWLLSPAASPVVRLRQEAVAELAPELDLRDDLASFGRLREDAKPNPELFLVWAESEPWLGRRPWLLLLARLATLVIWFGLLLAVAGFVPYLVVVPLLALNLILGQVFGAPIHNILARAASQEGAVSVYAEILRLVSEATFETDQLRGYQSDLRAGKEPAHVALLRLQRLAALVIPKSSLLYVPIQAVTLWDIHVLAMLEHWQRNAGELVRRWLETLGEVEAIAALAALADANPDWVFPELDAEVTRLTAERLGHPLLGQDSRVVNDVDVGPPGSFLLVTGSNMSGKSTLLRAIGVNIVLAGAGGPVCARSCRLPPVSLWTSIRVQDSLERGVSYFMAELQRLKQIVDAAGRLGETDNKLCCYLLDEMLHGTNTAERQIAARRIIAYLVAQGAIGAATTHDLTLADAPELRRAARPIHFTETVSLDGDRPGMSFDYRIRPGIATSTNALKLMELVGFDLGSTAMSTQEDEHP